jgi:hypothetical protein
MKRLSVIVVALMLAACESPSPKEPARAGEGAPASQMPVPQTQEVRRATPEPPVPHATPAPAPGDEKPMVPVEVQAPEASGVDSDYREVFPHVRFDAKAKSVQFDGVVPIDAHDANSPWVFLEVVVCTADTKEHEALVVTEAKASHVHAALLLAGLLPGKPGRWTFENDKLKPIAPEGDALRVTLTARMPDGSTKALKPEEMIVHAQSGRHFGEVGGRSGRWVFAGSQIVTRAGKEWYDADGAGTLIGLTTFGSETIAWSEVISHEAAVEEPVWIADSKATPPVGTPMTVTIQRAD